MRTATDLPHATRADDVRIPVGGGVQLYARVWRPVDGPPVPALLEYLPYRLTDWTSPRDAQRHPWYAGHGYASVRVDVRGHGCSDGRVTDEYSEEETADGVAVVEWLAEQPWCDGSVGMFGISWGGFNGLQVAARAPEALRAVVTVCSADDRYDNDVHYKGGSVLAVDMHAWAATMLAFAARPPDPEHVGPVWRERWLDHQVRDDYWRHGSVCEDYGAITAPVLAVGGWADPYRDTVLRLVEHLDAPVRGLLGPWSHQYPDRGLPPGPAIGFLQETLRWWDHWLKGVDRGVEDDPALRAWVSESVPPATTYDVRPGRWVAAGSWPTPDVVARPWPLGAVDDPAVEAAPVAGGEPAPGPRLRTTAPADGGVLVASPQRTGVDAGRSFPFGGPADLPPDQREADGRSVCFDALLDERVEVLGRARVRLRLACDAPRGQVDARLCDVGPAGASTLVTRGVLNLSSRHGRDRVVPMEPGVAEDVEVEMDAVGHAFPPGHRLRVALSSAYGPWVWPQAGSGALRVDPAGSALLLPERDPAADAAHAPVTFEEPEQAPALAVVQGTSGPERPDRRVERQQPGDRWVVEVDPRYGGTRTFPDGLEMTEEALERYEVAEGDPLSARTRSDWRVRLRRPATGWDVEVVTRSEIRCDAEAFTTTDRLEAREGGEVVHARTWERRIPRTAG